MPAEIIITQNGGKAEFEVITDGSVAGRHFVTIPGEVYTIEFDLDLSGLDENNDEVLDHALLPIYLNYNPDGSFGFLTGSTTTLINGENELTFTATTQVSAIGFKVVPLGSLDTEDATYTFDNFTVKGMQQTHTYDCTGNNYLASNYRYGFNGKELDSEVRGEGSAIEFGGRSIYDPRLGRFLSIDPKTSEYSWQTPYAYHRNSPITIIDWYGYGDPPYVKSNVNFIHFCSPTVTAFSREDGGTFTDAALSMNTSDKVKYSINMQQYEQTSVGATISYARGANVSMSGTQTQGFTIIDGVTQEGGRTSKTFYFAQSINGTWSAGFEDPPQDSKIAFGGGIPLIINGMPYGETKKYDSDGNMIQNSNDGYPFQNNTVVGKSIIAFNSRYGDFMVISQENGVEGMTLDQIRDHLISKGYTNALSFDGSTSATLVKDNEIINSPDAGNNNQRKNKSIPVGATITE